MKRNPARHPAASRRPGLQQASAESHRNFVIADAFCNPGQRLLSTVARATGEGLTNVVNYLENQQAGQGRRIANTLSEGFEARETAAQTERRLTEAGDEAANDEFGVVRDDAGQVNLVDTINHIDGML